MYFNLSSKLTRALIQELRHFFSFYPDMRSKNPEDDLVSNIKSKYSFGERGSRYIVVRASGSSQHIPLSADDFRNYSISYAGLRPVPGYPGTSIEWVGENALAIQQNGGMFPSPPGFYYIRMCEFVQSSPEDKTPDYWTFRVDPIYTVNGETVFRVTDVEYQLERGAFYSGALRLYRMPGNILLQESVNYEADPKTGVIMLHSPLGDDEFLSADYRVQGETLGTQFIAQRNRSNTQAIPGLFLAFGQRIAENDTLMIEVTESREIQAYEFGGRWETSIDVEVVAKDLDTQREILETALIFLRSQLRSRWSSEGIEIMQVNAGGESEEIYDQNDYFYRGTITLSIETEWTVWVPTAGRILRFETASQSPDVLAGLSDEEISQIEDGIRIGRRFTDFQDPFFNAKRGSITPQISNPTFPMV